MQGQLFQLMKRLESTTPHFIRCIKSNNSQSPGIYEQELVLQQLRCCGVLEVVRISRSGFPTRMSHQKFARRSKNMTFYSRINHVKSLTFGKYCSDFSIISLRFLFFLFCFYIVASFIYVTVGMASCYLTTLLHKIHWVFQLLFFISSIFCLTCIKLAIQNCFFVLDRYNE